MLEILVMATLGGPTDHWGECPIPMSPLEARGTLPISSTPVLKVTFFTAQAKVQLAVFRANGSQRRWLRDWPSHLLNSTKCYSSTGSPEEAGRWAEKQFAASHQMLGTVRINGLEIQVPAIPQLLITSQKCSPRRKRLIGAQSGGSAGKSFKRLMRQLGPSGEE